jgi:hypothetical protein
MKKPGTAGERSVQCLHGDPKAMVSNGKVFPCIRALRVEVLASPYANKFFPQINRAGKISFRRTKYQEPRTKFQVPRTKFQEPNSKSRNYGIFGIWFLEFGS